MAVSGLLRHGFRTAFQVLPALPDDEAVADSLYVVLDQHTRLLNPAELRTMASLASETMANCPSRIQSALSYWIEQHG